MKNNLKILSLLAIALLAFTPFDYVVAQVDIDMEKIREKCKDSPYEDRVRVTVARFNVTTRDRQAHAEFGNELTAMLTNTLQKVNCFRVLESIKNMTDMTDELNMGNSGYIDSESAPEIGKMLGAQAIFTGEVTEFHQSKGSGGALGLTLTSNKTKIGFIIKLINTETRELLWSESLEAEGKTPGSFSGAQLLGINLVGGNKKNNTLGDHIERGMIKAIYELTKGMDNIRFPEVEFIDEANTTLSIIDIKNTNFMKMKSLGDLLKTESTVKKVERDGFSSEYATASLKVRHEGSTEEFMDLLYAKSSSTLEISNLVGNTIEVTMK